MNSIRLFLPTPLLLLVPGLVLGQVPLGLTQAISPTHLAQLPATSQLRDGTVFFNQIPQLVGASTFDRSAFTFNPTYYFTLNVPSGSLVPLQRVRLEQLGGLSLIQFLPGRNQAYLAGRPRTPINVTLTSNSGLGNSEFILDPPVQPGQQVVLVLNPYRNPTHQGIYQFRVTVYPAGEKVLGNVTGIARLQFYNPGSGLF